VKLAVRRWANAPSMLTLVGDTSVTVPPPPAVRLNDPVAITDGRATPFVVKPVKVCMPGVQAKKSAVMVCVMPNATNCFVS
jgi:hypothetical protein